MEIASCGHLLWQQAGGTGLDPYQGRGKGGGRVRQSAVQTSASEQSTRVRQESGIEADACQSG